MTKTMTGECWLWAGSTFAPDDYGSIWHEGRIQRAHRVIYEALVGPIPDGLQIDHLCRTPRCVNPDHLEPVTARENMRRVAIHTRQKTCARGHDLTDERNVRVSYSKARDTWQRQCRLCRNIRKNQRMAAARQALQADRRKG